MATRVNAREEKMATLQSVMNVIATLDHDHPPRAFQGRPIDFRGLLQAQAPELDEEWSETLLVRRSGSTQAEA